MRKLAGLITAVAVAVGFVVPCSAETVYVKYRGLLNLDRLECEATDSSFVHRVCYDDRTGYLVVLLNDTYYHHCGVPDAVAQRLIEADSVGRYYNAVVRRRYDCRITPPPY